MFRCSVPIFGFDLRLRSSVAKPSISIPRTC